MASKALSAFGRAFADARAEGLSTFEYKGKQFTTETLEEAESRAQVKPAPPQGASQAQLQQTPAGQLMGSKAAKPPGLMQNLQANVGSILSGREEEIAGQVPQLGQVRSAFTAADQAAKAAGMGLVERDVERHKAGARNASLDVGFFAALLGSQGHEANTLVNTAQRILGGKSFGETSITGQALTPGRYAAESIQDSINNLFGQAEALLIQLGVGSREQPPSAGSVSIDRPGTRMASAGSTVENGVNALADLVGVFQQKLAEARSTPNAEPQIAAVQGSGREARI